MAVEGSIPAVELRVRRDSFGIWRVSANGASASPEAMGRNLENAIGSVVARSVDHPFDVRGLATAIELILGVKEAS